MEMKAQGNYVARGLSFRQAEFCELEAVVPEQQVQVRPPGWRRAPGAGR
jgi:hypothetical protein